MKEECYFLTCKLLDLKVLVHNGIDLELEVAAEQFLWLYAGVYQFVLVVEVYNTVVLLFNLHAIEEAFNAVQYFLNSILDLHLLFFLHQVLLGVNWLDVYGIWAQTDSILYVLI